MRRTSTFENSKNFFKKSLALCSVYDIIYTTKNSPIIGGLNNGKKILRNQ